MIQCDVLVINKSDLAPYVGVDLLRMVAEAQEIRQGRPVVVTNCESGEGIDEVVTHIARDVLFCE